MVNVDHIPELQAVAPTADRLIMEGLGYAGSAFAVGDTVIPCPVAGTLTLMEALGLPWVCGGVPTLEDCKAAYVLLESREDACGLVMAVRGTEDAVGVVASAFPEDLDAEGVGQAVTAYMDIAMTGFNYMPKGKHEEDPGDPDNVPEVELKAVFQADFLAVVTRVMGSLGVQPFDAMWREPLVRIGFCVAYNAIGNGAKNIGRHNTLDWSKVPTARETAERLMQQQQGSKSL